MLWQSNILQLTSTTNFFSLVSPEKKKIPVLIIKYNIWTSSVLCRSWVVLTDFASHPAVTHYAVASWWDVLRQHSSCEQKWICIKLKMEQLIRISWIFAFMSNGVLVPRRWRWALVGLLWGEAGAGFSRFRLAPVAPLQGTAWPLGHAGSTLGEMGLRNGKMPPATRIEGKSVRSSPESPEGRGGAAAQANGRHWPAYQKVFLWHCGKELSVGHLRRPDTTGKRRCFYVCGI